MVEAGLAYQEMIENGISEDTAKKIANYVGLANAALEFVQLDELIKAFGVLGKSGAPSTVLQKLAKELVKRGADVAKETAQEVAQEGVTITGAQLANRMETSEWAYGAEEVKGAAERHRTGLRLGFRRTECSSRSFQSDLHSTTDTGQHCV